MSDWICDRFGLRLLKSAVLGYWSAGDTACYVMIMGREASSTVALTLEQLDEVLLDAVDPLDEDPPHSWDSGAPRP